MSLPTAESFREAMRHVPAPVTVVTAGTANDFRGATIGSFTSLSLDPPLISFNLGHRSRLHTLLEDGAQFAVHVLSADQAALSRRFSRPGLSEKEQFADLSYTRPPSGPPILNDTALVLGCETDRMVSVGEKSIIIGHVLWMATAADPSSLLYFQREYHGMRSRDGAPSNGQSIRLPTTSASVSSAR